MAGSGARGGWFWCRPLVNDCFPFTPLRVCVCVATLFGQQGLCKSSFVSVCVCVCVCLCVIVWLCCCTHPTVPLSLTHSSYPSHSCGTFTGIFFTLFCLCCKFDSIHNNFGTCLFNRLLVYHPLTTIITLNHPSSLDQPTILQLYLCTL